MRIGPPRFYGIIKPMPLSLDQLPWLAPLLRAIATVAGAYLLGRLFNRFIAGHLAHLASGSHGPWDNIVVSELRTYVPLWSVLVGLRISLAYWPIPERWLHLAATAISVVGFASVTFGLAGIATGLLGTYGPRAAPGVPISGITRAIVRLIVVAGGLLVVLNEIGIEIRPMLAALGVGGLAVALALQEPLANLFAGLFVSLAGQVRIGDHVRLDSGVEGKIVDFNWRSTWLEVPGGSVAVVPNSKLSQSIVTNFNLPNPELAIPVDFTVRFNDVQDGSLFDPSIYGGAQSEAVYDVNPEQDALDLSLARAALLTGLPTLGICRGAQVLNVAAGGRLIADLPPSAVEHLHRPNPGEALDFLWHSVTMAPSRLREHLGVDAITVASGHHQGIDRLGTGLFTSAVAADGLVEAFEDESGLVLGVQWHPEASGTPAAERDAPFLVFAETVREHSCRCARV